jgi:hypothetical protein
VPPHVKLSEKTDKLQTLLSHLDNEVVDGEATISMRALAAVVRQGGGLGEVADAAKKLGGRLPVEAATQWACDALEREGSCPY